jgi:hypothetical protein
MKEIFDDRLSAAAADYVTNLDFGARIHNMISSLHVAVKPSREVSLVITKLEEAEHWWKAAVERSR